MKIEDAASALSEGAQRVLAPIKRRHPLSFVAKPKRTRTKTDPRKRRAFLSEGGSTPSETELERLIGTNDLVDQFYLERALVAAQPVARISIRSLAGHERGCATGFMVSPRLLMTNQHVFRTAEEATSSTVEFNFCDDIAGNHIPSFSYRLRPDLYFFNHADLDFALVSVEPASTNGGGPRARFGYLRLIAESGKVAVPEWLTIIQHPGGQRRQFAIRENQLADDTDPKYLAYMSDTAQGSSGAPVFNDSFQIAALHHQGKANRDGALYVLKDGRKVASLEGIDESEVDWIANAGVRISRICAAIFAEAPDNGGHLAELQEAMKGGDVLSLAFQNPNPKEIMSIPFSSSSLPSSGGQRVPLIVDLQFSFQGQPLTLGVASQPVPAAITAIATDGSAEFETMREPIVDKDYSKRKGFNPKFLGVATPLPTVTVKKVVAKMKNGGSNIPYEHFSVVIHKDRRLAIFTASNVDGSDKARMPEKDRDYSRKGLTGLGKNDIEKWVTDSRLDEAFSLPDKFYSEDNKAFDKGHIARRDDVCWGASFAEVQRANGDTYHTTNCSPQRANFNQSKLKGIWGNLENFVLKQAKLENYCLFAGPVLADDDPIFAGKDNTGKVNVRIPRDFWKVVCAVKNKKLQVWAFLLEQDLTGIPMEEEFQLTPEWVIHSRSLKDLEKKVKLVKFQKAYHTADQFGK
ncbi:MAG: endonuclease mitochondrial [Verrucomicrobiota bacterium]